jgi:hypothetical protein
LRAPGTDNGVNEIAAQTPDVQLTAERIGLLLTALFSGLILNNNNGVHGKFRDSILQNVLVMSSVVRDQPNVVDLGPPYQEGRGTPYEYGNGEALKSGH